MISSRRSFLVAVGAGLLAPVRAISQQKTARIGLLGLANATAYAAQIDAFRAGLKDLGYVEGKNIYVEYRWAEGHYERLKDLAAELVQQKVELIVTHGPGTAAAKNVTTTLPIVTYVGDIVALGFASSLAHPGGNITGSSFFGPEIAAKRLEILKEALPRLNVAGALYNTSANIGRAALEAIHAAAKQLKLKLDEHGVRGPDEIEGAFAAMARNRVQGVVVLDDPMLIANFKTVAAQASKNRLASVGFTGYADAGGLITSGVSLIELWRRHAYFVDKILKGAKPGDIPIQQPTKFELVLNQRTATALGLKLPQSLIQRADKITQ